jgi:hypothetical protein
MCADERFYSLAFGEVDLDLDTVMKVGTIDEGTGFGEKPSGVDGEYLRVFVLRQHHMGEYLVFKAHTGSEGDLVCVVFQEESDHLFGRFGGHVPVKFIGLFVHRFGD